MRPIEMYELTLGSHQLAAATRSYGDLVYINSPQSSKKGVFLADIEGRSQSSRELMRRFLYDSVEQGWGIDGNSEEEMSKLSELFKSRQGYARGCSVCSSYIQFDGQNISLVN